MARVPSHHLGTASGRSIDVSTICCEFYYIIVDTSTVTALGTRWGLAEGRVGGPEQYQTYILLANPGATDADVTITFLRETGVPVQHVVTVPAGRRYNVAVTGDGEIDLHDERFGALITSTQPIAVERAMYGNAASQIWQTGTNAVATRLP
jgi:hypothetical protein